MDLLGFSSEDLANLNSEGSRAQSKTFSVTLDPIPDLSGFSKEVQSKYHQIREAEIHRLTTRLHNQSPISISNEKNLNSQLPRVKKFVNKLKNATDEIKDELIKESSELSLKNFIDEAAHSLSENKLQKKDLRTLVDVASKLHQMYPEFQKKFLTYLKKQHKDGDLIKKRNVLRFVAELIAFALWNDIGGFLKVIKDYVRAY